MDAIIVENLTKTYAGGVQALKSISFRVKKGTIFGFLGPNGAGKTTTQKILCTLLKPTSGNAIVMGHDVVKDPWEVRRKIGVVFQDPALDDKLTGKENLEYHARLYGLRGDEIKRKIKELMSLVELEGWEDKLVSSYSGGMRRKLEVARSVMHDPELLFLDEPTIGLDAHTRKKIWEHILRIKKEKGLTIFLTTHYIEEAEKLCDRVAVIDKGRIVAEGTPEELKKKFGRKRLVVVFSSEADKKKALEMLKREMGEMRVIVEKEKSVELESSRIEEKISALRKLFVRRGVRLIELSVKYPSLEDVYLELTEDVENGNDGGAYIPPFRKRRFSRMA